MPSDLSAAPITNAEWLSERLAFAMKVLGQSVTIDPHIRGGVPVVAGTRITVARIVAELADNNCLLSIAEEFDISIENLKDLIGGIAITLDSSHHEPSRAE